MENVERFERGRQMFEEVLDLHPEARAAYLDQACAGDPALRQEVEALLQAYARSDEVKLPDLPLRPMFSSHSEPDADTMPTGMILRRGMILDKRYLVTDVLGAGGMGIVYEAEDKKLRRTVALKQAKTQFRDSYKRELLLSGFRHPNLPKIHDLIYYGEERIMVMEYIDGETLAEKLKKRGRAFDVDQVLDWAVVLLQALTYLHTYHPSNETILQDDLEPILHRDIKPGNLMVSREGHLFLMDFGIARRGKTSGSATAQGFGTIPYAPPEQINLWKAHVSVRSDLYALGATLYHLLLGEKPPYEQERVDARNANLPDPLERRLASQTTFGPDIAGWFQRAMALNPEDRPISASDMLSELHRLRKVGPHEHEKSPSPPISEASPEPITTQRKPVPLYRSLRLASVAVVLLLVTGLGLWYSNWPITQEGIPPVDEVAEAKIAAGEPDAVEGEEQEEATDDADASGSEAPDVPDLKLQEPSGGNPPAAPDGSETEGTKTSEPLPAEDPGEPEPPLLPERTEVQATLAFEDGNTTGAIFIDGEPITRRSGVPLTVDEHLLMARRRDQRARAVRIEYLQDGEPRSQTLVPVDGEHVVFKVEPAMDDLRIFFQMDP